MIFTDINILSLLAAIVAQSALGAVWYSPHVFGSVWMRVSGKTPEDIKNGGRAVALSIFVTAVQVLFVAMLISGLGAYSLVGGMLVGLGVWFGFVCMNQLNDVLFEGHAFQFFLIKTGYPMVGYLISGAIIGAWPVS